MRVVMKLQFSQHLALAALLVLIIGSPLLVDTADALAYNGRPPSKVGIAKHYSAGMFARVARNRGMQMRSDVAGYAAVTDCSMIGKVVAASINGGRVERFQVLDCSAPKDRPRHIREGLVIEVDYATAKRRGFLGEGKAPAKVWYP